MAGGCGAFFGGEGTGNAKRAGRCGHGVKGCEAFRCPGANLLPITKFIGMGLFIKCLGQVDLRDAPLRHRTPCLRVRTSRPSYHFPGGGLAAGMWRTGMNEDRMVEMMEIEW